MNSTNPAVQAKSKQPPMSADTMRNIDVLNAELGGEYFGIAAYDAALESGLLDAAVSEVAKKFQSDHKEHAQRLREEIIGAGGDPVESRTWEQYASDYPPPPLESQVDVLRYAASLEKGGASAAVAAVGKLSSPEAAQLVASIAGAEAMHWSVLLGALGENPAPVSFIPLPEQ